MTGKTTDLIKDLSTYGAAFFVTAFGMYEVAKLAEVGVIDGATTMTFFTTLAAAAVAFLFGVALSRSTTRAYEKGLNTPGPNDNATNITADTATVTDSGPTTVSTAPKTPVVNRSTTDT